MAHDVFLSYSSKDKAAAEAVCAALEHRGVAVWMAPRDIPPGASWAGSIVEAIDGARAIVLVFSSAANESGQIEREVQRALDKNLRIIPFRIEDVKPKEALAYCIGAVQWLDAFAPPIEPHYEALAKVVRRTTAPQPEAGAPAAAAAAPAPGPAPPGRRRGLAPALIAAAAVLVVAGVVSSLVWKEQNSTSVTVVQPPADPAPKPNLPGTPSQVDSSDGLPIRVYFQFSNSNDRSKIEAMRQALNGQSVGDQSVGSGGQKTIIVPPIENVNTSIKKPVLKCFKEVECKSYGQLILSKLKEAGAPNAMELQYTPGFENSSNIRPLHFEAWVGSISN